MRDTVEHGRRPHSGSAREDLLGEIPALPICPGLSLPRQGENRNESELRELRDSWGPIIELWEGYAADEEIRFRGSSGGVTTALALHAIEKEGFEGASHVRARSDAPLLNETVFSRSRESLVAGAGSRYAPASPCDGLESVASASGSCVFIGKPCDVAGAEKARHMSPALDANLGLTIAIFCAGTPSIAGTEELAKQLGAPSAESIQEVRYRGNGWPGDMEVTYADEESGECVRSSISYAKGWGDVLQRHRQWRCHVCPDHTGEFADLSIGDPWYRPSQPGDQGRSLVLVRTERGRRFMAEAIRKGTVIMERREPWVLEASQPHLVRAQASVWGRTLACRVAGMIVPRFEFRRRLSQWCRKLTGREKLQSILGTFRRVFRKSLRSPERTKPFSQSRKSARHSHDCRRHRETSLPVCQLSE